ncbi:MULTISPECIES: phage tail tape measure protein [Providencia]|uniref:phage tail tape measure protein n=1 Tax=Providencia TaxID=586 RepID=UPI001419A4B3|nr:MULTISPECIES: phage tail tape measure protein [Providencia]NIA43821.1 phage tail tape measure protein [Providencia rettgeri]NIA97650.1 phage tail tape measure protein [Providencia rettgeri]NIB15237.1 phage tail tape measure protein [Providencia rettgeri]NIB35449.1 phage tail tape measure protein [Providencia rettgeri]NIL71380.1 phage tail tape measure protein [Providencia sp. 504mA]
MSKDLRLQVILSAVDKFTKPFKSAQASNKKLAETLRQSKQQLKELNNQAKQIDGFKKTKQSLDSASQAYQQATAKVSRLARELSTVQNPTRAQSRELDRAKAAAAKLKTETGTLSASLQRQREALKGSGISTRQLSQAQIKLNSDIASTSRRLQQQEQQLKRVANQEKRMSAAKNSYQNAMGVRNKMAGSGAGMLASGVGLGYAAKKVLVPGYDFEIGMSKVQALTRLDKNSDDYKMLREQARDLGATTAFTANEVAQGQAFYAMAGFKPEQIKNAMKGTLSMSLAGDIDLATTADIGSNILTGFKLNSNEMNRVSDTLVGVFTRANVNLAMLGETMKYVAPPAAGLGVDLETAAAAAGKLGDAGIQSSMAGTSLKSIFGRLAAPTSEVSKALKEINLKTTDSKGNFREFTEILVELDKKTKGMGNAKRAGLFKKLAGEEAFSALMVLTDQASTGSLQQLIAELKAAKGEAEKVANVMTDNLDGDLKNLTSAYEDVGIQIFGGADSPLRDITKRVTDLISKFGQWAKKNPELVKQITMITLGLGAVLAVGGGITLMIAALIGPLAMAKLSLSVLGIKGSGFLSLLIKPIKLIGTAFMMLGRALLANPIILFIAGIAGAAYLIYKYWDDIAPYAKGLWNLVTTIFKDAFEAIKSLILNWTPAGWIYKHWDSIVSITVRMCSLLKKTISEKWDQIVADVKGLPERFKQIGGEIIDSLKNGILEKWESLKAQFAELKQMATNILPDWMLSDETKTVRAMSQVTVIQAGMKNAGMFDNGGFIPRGQFGIAGEYGPELVNGPAHITSRRKTATLAAAALTIGSMTATAKPIHPYALPANSYQSAPTTINQSNHAANTAPVTINVYPLPSQSANDIAREVARQLEQNQRREQARRLSRYQDSEDD